MRKTRLPDTSADDLEQRFYEAMRRADLTAMMACWAEDDEAICIHPGGARLLGSEAIRTGFASIFEQGSVAVTYEVVHRIEQPSAVIHSVVETVHLPTDDGGVDVAVWATNVFAQTAAGWRLVVHHASPAMRGPAAPGRPPVSNTLH